MSEEKTNWMNYALAGVLAAVGTASMILALSPDLRENLANLLKPKASNPQPPQVIWVPQPREEEEETGLRPHYSRELRPKWSHSSVEYDMTSRADKQRRQDFIALVDKDRMKQISKVDRELEKEREQSSRAGRFKLRYT